MSESENEYGKKSEKFDKFSSTLVGKSVEVINYHFFQVKYIFTHLFNVRPLLKKSDDLDLRLF